MDRRIKLYAEYADIVDGIIHSDIPHVQKLERIEGYTYELWQILSNEDLAETLLEEQA